MAAQEENNPTNIEVEEQHGISLNEYKQKLIIGSKTWPGLFTKMNGKVKHKMGYVVGHQFIAVVLQSIFNKSIILPKLSYIDLTVNTRKQRVLSTLPLVLSRKFSGLT